MSPKAPEGAMHSFAITSGADASRAQPLFVTTSWDDGHPADLRLADLLERHGVAGTFYVPCRNSEGRPVMCSGEVARVGARFEIGGHTSDHINLTGVPPQEAANQIASNKRWLEDLLGREVRGFAYVRGRHDRAARQLVGKAGYRYARTAKSLMSTPGRARFQVPTTVQFFAHTRSTYIRNYLSGGPTLQRTAVLCALLNGKPLAVRLHRAAEICARSGGYFHLWGHSWELERHDLWGELDALLHRLREFDARFVTNDAWCANLTTKAEGQAPAAIKEGRASPDQVAGSAAT